MKKIVVTLLFLLFALPCFAEWHYPEKYDRNTMGNNYPAEMLSHFGKQQLDFYFSLPQEQQTDDQINSWGNYPVENNGPALNSKYAPDSTIYPFRSKAGQARADYYFQKGLQMPRLQSK